MLRLDRKPGQSIMIGDDVKIKVCGFNKNGEIKTGIEAPKNVSIARQEIHKVNTVRPPRGAQEIEE